MLEGLIYPQNQNISTPFSVDPIFCNYLSMFVWALYILNA